MRGPQITIKDIARELGISPSTVSRALKDHPDISLSTRKKVQEYAEENKYKPNAVALSLLQSKTNIIGVIIPELVHYFFSSVISGIEEVAFESGYQVMIFQSNEQFEREKAAVQAMMKSRVDGILISLSKQTIDFNHLQYLEKSGIPVVFFDRASDNIMTHKVIIDDLEGARKVVNHLIQSGRKRIAHLAGPQNLQIGINRLNGYKKALQDAGLGLDHSLIRVCDNYDDALKITQELLELPEPPDAIFSVNDLTAAGVIQAIKKAGLSVPADISVAGFTNDRIASITEPTLTSVEQHGYQMGQEAMRLLLKRFSTKIEDYSPETIIIPSTLIIRASSTK
jgi:DNA-binding LacI/PurR family transcriptional regulator